MGVDQTLTLLACDKFSSLSLPKQMNMREKYFENRYACFSPAKNIDTVTTERCVCSALPMFAYTAGSI